MNKTIKKLVVFLSASSIFFSGSLFAGCQDLPDHATLTTALKNALPVGAGGNAAAGIVTNGGLDFPMWATIVDEHGIVCEITFSGSDNRDQWQASRAISAQKAYTANSLTVSGNAPLNGFGAIFSTALLYTPSQPGQFLWGLHQSNPVNPQVVYAGPIGNWGESNDPMKKKIPGGVNTFGGGIALFVGNTVVGGLGVSGDTSCADHNVALRVRDNLGLFNPGAQYADNIVYDIKKGVSASGFGHPTCPGDPGEVNVNEAITGVNHPVHDTFPF
jgi:uncharacterized protein GlcG (DUF336 family)